MVSLILSDLQKKTRSHQKLRDTSAAAAATISTAAAADGAAAAAACRPCVSAYLRTYETRALKEAVGGAWYCGR